jgi:hypothetical protein
MITPARTEDDAEIAAAQARRGRIAALRERAQPYGGYVDVAGRWMVGLVEAEALLDQLDRAGMVTP